MGKFFPEKCPKSHIVFFCAISIEEGNYLHGEDCDEATREGVKCDVFPDCNCEWAKKLKRNREIIEALS